MFDGLNIVDRLRCPHLTTVSQLTTNQSKVKCLADRLVPKPLGFRVSFNTHRQTNLPCVYAIVEQRSGSNQGLVAARSRLPKRGLTISRLELVAAHMAINLASNVKEVLIGFPVTKVQCWLDSSVVLHWITGHGEYKQFVPN